LFISVTDDQPTTYEYHHLFRGFLEKRSSRRKPERRRGLARKAGSILANHEEWVERGVELLIDAGNLEELVGTIEAVAPGICRKGRVETVRNWTRVLTDADRRSVALELLLSRSLSDLGRRQEALQILEALSKKGDKCDVQVSDDVERDRLYTLGEILSECEEWEEYIRTMEALGKLSEKSSSPETLVSYYALKAKHLGTYLGRWSEAAQIIDKAIRSYNGAEALSLVSLLTTSSYVYTYLGRLDLGRSRAEDAYRLCKDQGRLVGQARILNNLAYQHHLDGDYSGAINLILDATRVAERLGNVEVVDLTRITLIEILGDLGRKQESADLCAKVVARALDQHESPYWKKYALALDSCLRRRRGDLAGALRSIRKGKDFARGSSHSRLVTEQVGLLSVMNPQRVKGEVWTSRRKVAFTQQDWTLVLYFLARSLFTLHERTRAAWWARASIRQSSTRGAVQLVAAELVADPEFLTFVEEALAKEPAWAQIHERISMIQGAGAHLHYELENIVTKRGGLTIEALGVSRVHLDGVEVTTLSPQETRLLIVLADLGQTRSEALGEMFWPKAPYENQMRSLHTAVYHLRNALGRDVIQHASGGYRLVEDFVRSFDVANFEQGVELATRLSPSRLEWSRVALEALALYKGEYLAGESDVWAVARRRELEEEFVDLAVGIGSQAHFAVKRESALRYLRKAIEINPYREDANTAYMDSLAALGRRVEMVQHRRRYESLLREDLGIEPESSSEEGLTSRTDFFA
jgi:DNA-binding SARP family transcriptional activator